MIQTCIHNSLKSRFVLMDSWLSSEESFEFITAKGRHFIAALKDNRLIALRQEDRKKKRFIRVDELDFPEQTSRARLAQGVCESSPYSMPSL